MSSSRSEKFLSLASIDYAGMSSQEIKDMCRAALEAGMHGLCFSPYMENQSPGDQISDEQIRRRMELIKPYTKWIRSLSCTDGNENIP